MPEKIASELKLSNIPTFNLLSEFFRWNKLIRSQEFTRQFAVGYTQPIHTSLLIWGGDPSDLLTLILQRTILGLESYVIVAVWMELGKSGRLTRELNESVRNPFRIPRQKRGTAYCYYNALPSLIDPKYAIETMNRFLWHELKTFYQTVRNKILHGSQIESGNPGVLYRPFDMFARTYQWVDQWHRLEVRDDRPLKMRFVIRPSKKL